MRRDSAIPSPTSEELPASYTYLLGVYLGDGCISAHRRDVFRLRISLDLRYPGIIQSCAVAIQDLLPSNRVAVIPKRSSLTGRREFTYVEVSAYSKLLPAYFPQHGPGPKHKRDIILVGWQEDAVRASPHGLIRGLIHTDGSRSINTGRGGWSYPRYALRNRSLDILSIFEWACSLIGARTTRSKEAVYVSRKADVSLLDTFVGPKR